MVFTAKNTKIALFCESMAVTYHIKLFRTGADRHYGVLISLFFLVAKTIDVTEIVCTGKSIVITQGASMRA